MSTSKKNELLNYTIKYGIDLWLFNQLFTFNEKNMGYEHYRSFWKDCSRIMLDEEIFKEVVKLLERYIKSK